MFSEEAILNTGPLNREVKMYDTSLRDGAQDPRVMYTVSNKLETARLLDHYLQMDYIEGGWPGANPSDTEFFRKAHSELELTHAKLAAFGSTRRVGVDVEDDPLLRALIEAKTPVVTLVGKASLYQVKYILRTTPEENLKMIEESITYLKANGIQEVGFDAEHFFDGYHGPPEIEPHPAYALETLRVAAKAGAQWVALCDTNGGTLPDDIYQIVLQVVRDEPLHRLFQEKHPEQNSMTIGIHAHEDQQLGLANTLKAIEAGATQAQGTMNGGERVGNVDLLVLMLIRTIKQQKNDLSEEQLRYMKQVSERILTLAHLPPNPKRPFVGDLAAAHKAGTHVDGIKKTPRAYQHFDPEQVGNKSRIILSELSGRASISLKLEEMTFPFYVNAGFIAELTTVMKEKISQGYSYVDQDASFDLLARRRHPEYRAPYELHLSQDETGQPVAILSVREGTEKEMIILTSSEKTERLFAKLRESLSRYFSWLSQVALLAVQEQAEHGISRVIIQVSDGKATWSTVGASGDHVIASLEAVHDALEYAVYHSRSSAERSLQAKRAGWS